MLDPDYTLLPLRYKFIVWVHYNISVELADKLYEFDLGITSFREAFLIWGFIMTTNYKIANKRIFGLTWFDTFYGELNGKSRL